MHRTHARIEMREMRPEEEGKVSQSRAEALMIMWIVRKAAKTKQRYAKDKKRW